MEGNTQERNWMNAVTAAGFLLIGVLTVLGFANGVFESRETFRDFITGCGLGGTFLFIAFQAVQVVIPFLPGSIGCVAGVLAFGPFYGFFYNYIGICAGSILAFLFARRYGRAFVRRVAGEKKYEKYIGWLNKGKKFDYLFAAAIALPAAPDDLFCLLAGLSDMRLKKLTAMVLLGKPLALVAYSVAFSAGLDSLMKLL